jgi:hypothetical protein
MHHSVSIESDDEHKLRILHAHLSRKREALRKIEMVVTDAALRGALPPPRLQEQLVTSRARQFDLRATLRRSNMHLQRETVGLKLFFVIATQL